MYPETDVVSASSTHFQRGLDLFTERPDKEWSLTDCISFRIMEQEGIDEALSFDHHFEQAGYRCLLA